MPPRSLEIQRLRVALQTPWIKPVVAVGKLHNTPLRIPHRQIILRRQILQRLHQPPLHIPRLRRLHRRIHQPLPPRNRMEQKLGGGETRIERIAHEALRRRFFRLLREMRQRPILKPIRHTMPRDNLLPHARHHLAHIDHAALRATGGHDERRVEPRELLHAGVADRVAHLGEDAGDHGFERLLLIAARLVFELALFGEGDEVEAGGVGFFDEVVFGLGEAGAGDDVVYAQGEAKVGCRE